MLARLAIRLATVEALKGATFVGDNVLDSQIGALDVAADGSIRSDQEKPFLSVYTDASKIEDDLALRTLHRCGQIDLTIEAGVTAAMVETDADTGESQIVGIGIPATDPAMEMFLDCVDRQVVNALTDPANAWAELWRGLSSSIVKIERKRTSDAAGTRIAAHQTVITLDLLPDPVFGEPVAETSIWAALMDKTAEPMLPNPDYNEGDPDSPALIVAPEMVARLAVMQQMIGAGIETSNAASQQRRFGVTLDEMRAMLDGSAVDGAEPDIVSVEIEVGP